VASDPRSGSVEPLLLLPVGEHVDEHAGHRRARAGEHQAGVAAGELFEHHRPLDRRHAVEAVPAEAQARAAVLLRDEHGGERADAGQLQVLADGVGIEVEPGARGAEFRPPLASRVPQRQEPLVQHRRRHATASGV
jgi:hypothetical protein